MNMASKTCYIPILRAVQDLSKYLLQRNSSLRMTFRLERKLTERPKCANDFLSGGIAGHFMILIECFTATALKIEIT